MDVVKIDVEKLLETLRVSKHGTGSVATAARVSTDTVQRIIGRGEAAKEDAEALATALGTRAFIVGEVERIPSIEEVWASIMDGNDLAGQVERAKQAYAEESAREKPRKTLLKKIEEEFGAELGVEPAKAPAKKAPVKKAPAKDEE